MFSFFNQLFAIIFLIAVLVLIFPSFVKLNNNSKVLIRNIIIWLIIIIILMFILL